MRVFQIALTLGYCLAFFTLGLMVNQIWTDSEIEPITAFFFGIPFGWLLFDLWSDY